MKNSLRIAVITLILFLVAVVCRAAEPEDFYRDFEFQIDGFYQTATPDFEAETGSSGIGANVFFNRNFGLGVSTALENMNGHLIDSVSLRGIYRVPINRSAIYGYGGSTRLLEREEWTIDLGVGVEHRFAPSFGIFAEAGMQKLLKHSAMAIGRIGVRLSL